MKKPMLEDVAARNKAVDPKRAAAFLEATRDIPTKPWELTHPFGEPVHCDQASARKQGLVAPSDD